MSAPARRVGERIDGPDTIGARVQPCTDCPDGWLVRAAADRLRCDGCGIGWRRPTPRELAGGGWREPTRAEADGLPGILEALEGGE